VLFTLLGGGALLIGFAAAVHPWIGGPCGVPLYFLVVGLLYGAAFLSERKEKRKTLQLVRSDAVVLRTLRLAGLLLLCWLVCWWGFVAVLAATGVLDGIP
jgi:hypothetical protein